MTSGVVAEIAVASGLLLLAIVWLWRILMLGWDALTAKFGILALALGLLSFFFPILLLVFLIEGWSAKRAGLRRIKCSRCRETYIIDKRVEVSCGKCGATLKHTHR